MSKYRRIFAKVIQNLYLKRCNLKLSRLISLRGREHYNFISVSEYLAVLTGGTVKL